MERRTLLWLLGAGGLAGLAGCSTEGGSSGLSSPSRTAPETMTQNETDTNTPESGDDGLVTVTAEGSVESTVDRITADIEASDLTLLTTIDHAGNAASVDAELPPTTLLLVGNPAVGVPLMQASRTVAIDLPQKLLVWGDDGQTMVAYNDPQYLAQRHGIDGQSDRLAQIRSVLDGLATGESQGG
ncbi:MULTISPECIES: DUF302 domain-containing protein [Haloarcula]|uniref:DUF302 domain-containing protein n=1 Tax=Haloarcula TaxID=2237 RepID=UPI0023E7F034|nr:DUF302 domain-containing protein [Halomicroarcula sp. SHR3]